MDDESLAAEAGEYLDPGYDRQTPGGDNLLIDFARAEKELWSSWGESVEAEVGGDEDAGVLWVDSGSASVFGNPVLWTRPVSRAEASELVQRQAEVFSRRSGAPYLLYSAFPTPDLSAYGLQPVGHPPCMVRVPGLAAGSPLAPSGLSVRRVESLEQLNDFERTLVEAYPIPDLLPWSPGVFLGSKLTAHPRWHLFVGCFDGIPVATAAAYVTEHAVDVTLVTCLPEMRGRGFGRAVTQAAADVDRSKPALLLASDDGQPVYRAMGFRALTRFSLWIGTRPNS
jgi:GNAT superfamily N-acetyltransferase